MNATLKDGQLQIDLDELFRAMSDDEKRNLLEQFTFSELIPAIEQQLKHQTLSWSRSADGRNDGEDLRAHICRIQGLEPAWKRDYESRLQELQRACESYKRFADWYWAVYRLSSRSAEWKGLLRSLRARVGDPTHPQPSPVEQGEAAAS